MAKIMMKIKKDSHREFLTTPSGFTIDKKKFVEVEDTDSTIQSFILNRNDIDIKEVNKKIKDGVDSTTDETFKEKKEDDKSTGKKD